VFTVPDFPVALDGQFAGEFIKHQAEKQFVPVKKLCILFLFPAVKRH
jgi:hypothetical protein